MVFGQQRRQAATGAGFHCADAQLAAGNRVVVDGTLGLFHQREDALAVVEKHFPCGTDRQPAPGANEQRGTQLAFQLLDACGDVGRHAVQLQGGLGHAAGLCHGFHHFQLGQFHRSVPVITEVRNG
jgi:hypothetical protein